VYPAIFFDKSEDTVRKLLRKTDKHIAVYKPAFSRRLQFPLTSLLITSKLGDYDFFKETKLLIFF
jgi:hypothetical protein